MMLKHVLILMSILLLTTLSANAQKKGPPITKSDTLSSSLILGKVGASSSMGNVGNVSQLTEYAKLPPLGAIIDSAMVNSPLLKVQDEQITISEIELERRRKLWLENINLESYARYANNTQVVTGSFDTGVTTNLNTNNMQFLYGGGITVKVPLFTFYGRGKQLSSAKAQIRSAQYQRLVLEQELRKTLIELYNRVLLCHSLLVVKIEALQTSSIAVNLGEIDFRNNRINISDLSKIADAHMKNQTEYEQVLSELRLSMEMLQEVSGYKFLQK